MSRMWLRSVFGHVSFPAAKGKLRLGSVNLVLASKGMINLGNFDTPDPKGILGYWGYIGVVLG